MIAATNAMAFIGIRVGLASSCVGLGLCIYSNTKSISKAYGLLYTGVALVAISLLLESL